MRGSCGTIIKCLWVSAGLFMLPLGLGTCLIDPGYYASSNLIPIMLVLSFPCGPIALLVGALFIDASPLLPPFHYSLLWLVAFLAGYAQWFHVVPELIHNSEVITLGLTRSDQLAIPAGKPDVPAAAYKKERSQIRPQRIAPFDGRGHSPLERAIHKRRSRPRDAF